jgi:hypothetical protein
VFENDIEAQREFAKATSAKRSRFSGSASGRPCRHAELLLEGRTWGAPIHACFGTTATRCFLSFTCARGKLFYNTDALPTRERARLPVMASPPPISQPVAARSPEKAKVDLRHPIPDLQSLQGAYVGNIERLEEHAERMSESGSDLGEEIRKLHTELKRSDSRRQSFDESSRQYTSRSRNVSISSHANSIVDVNGAARWGGYSPGGYVTSPVGSLRSNSWTNPSASAQRQRSESKASRLGQVVHPDEIVDGRDDFLNIPPGSPQSLRSVPLAVHSSDSPPPQNVRKVSSFTQKYEEIANELRDELRNSVILDAPIHRGEEQHSEEYLKYATRDDYPDRPPTAASTDTSREARTAWQDFDGVHCPDTVPEEPEPTHSVHSRHSSFTSMLRLTDPSAQEGVPPPDDNMVFYPAPVPRLLNLPKRLSQLPPSDVQARRRTQVLDSMQAQNDQNRKSAPLLGAMLEAPSPAKKNRQSMLNLPPQLRASAYFDHQVVPSQEFAVQGESAEDTLDSILNASARAPVSAFTDHPFSGHVGPEVYGPEQKRMSKMPEVPPTLAETRRRSSFFGLDTKRNSSGDPLNKLKKRNSSADMNLLIVKASESRMSLGDQLDEREEHTRGAEDHVADLPPRLSFGDLDGRNPDDVHAEDHPEEEHKPEEVEEPQYFGAPTTLLAELQLRKAKQKTRNLNYATLVEQGNMPTHRTLLQLDDIAEKQKQKRLKKKVNLAWEAQAEDDDSDDDVPLGVLYKQPNQQQDRPLGLIARRELEDQEPLSLRRSRLTGRSPNQRSYLGTSPSQMHLAVPTTTTPGPDTDEEGHEGETLGERMRRLREKKELDEALGTDVRKSTISLDFASEMLSKFGGPEDSKPKDIPQPSQSPGAEEEETLGQRRARLQAEAAARGDAQPETRPGLRPRHSMADILSANPIDMHNQARKISDQQLISHLPPGSLLQQNHVSEERRKAERLNQNMRASSYGSFYDPLVGTPSSKKDEDQPLAMKIQAYKNRMTGVPGSQGMTFNNGLATPNMNMGDPRQTMMMGMNGMGMMSSPNLGMMGQQGMMPMNMGMMQPQMGMGGMQHPGMGPRQSSMMSMPMTMNGMPMQMGGMGMPMNGMPMMGMNGMGMMAPPMDPRQRDQIDRWMQNVQH